MKKILLPFEGDNYPAELLEFTRQLNTLSPVLLTAAFVPEIDYAHLWSISGGGMAGATYVPEVSDESAFVERNSARLKGYCEDHGIRFRIHEDRFDFALAAIRKESIFADLLALSCSHFFDLISSRHPNAYMKETLHGTKCPVMLVPDQPFLPGELILAYDGSPASVYAIKQFAYLFPELSGTPASLLYLRERKDDSMPDEKFIEELASQHFRDLRVLKTDLRPEDFFDTLIIAHKDPWLICGAYGRSDLSRFFSGSFISGMIKMHNVPVFLAHP